MAIFQNNPEEWQRLDWSILQNGWTSLYWKNEILENDLLWFKSKNTPSLTLNAKRGQTKTKCTGS